MRKHVFMQSSRQESHLLVHFASLLMEALKSPTRESKNIEIKIYIMKKSTPASLHLRNDKSSKSIFCLFSSCFHLSKPRGRASKMIRGLEHVICEKEVRELHLFILRKRR